MPCNNILQYRDSFIVFSLGNWAIFLLERAPPFVFLLLSAGPCLTGLYMTQGYINIEKFIWAFMGELVSLFNFIYQTGKSPVQAIGRRGQGYSKPVTRGHSRGSSEPPFQNKSLPPEKDSTYLGNVLGFTSFSVENGTSLFSL